MKKLIVLSLITAGLFSSAFADEPLIAMEHVKIVSIFHVNDSTLNEVKQGQHPDYIIEFPEKTLIPVGFFLKGDLVDLVDNGATLPQLKIKKTFYTRVKDGKLLFSVDLNDWKEFTSFVKGNVTFNVVLDQTTPVLSIGLESNLR